MIAPVDVTHIRIETERLILRAWRESDLEDFYEYAKVDGVGQMAGWLPHKNKEESRRILQLFLAEKKTLAMELKENGKVIGSVGLEWRDKNLGIEDQLAGREIGYVLSKDYWGRGIMPEAVKAVVRYCFENLNCDYLICSCSPENSQSARVIEKSGFRFVMEKSRNLRDGTVRTARYHVLDKQM